MNHDHDPVDSALKSLRSRAWTAESFNPKLEEKLMQQFNRNEPGRAFVRRPSWALALGILFVGGVTFAAAGGIEKIRSLFVTVEVDGEGMQVELQPVSEDTYEGTLETETQDGRQASIQVSKTQSAEEGDSMQVHVNVTGDGAEDEQVEHICRQRQVIKEPQVIDAAELDGLEPIHEWTDAEGNDRALYKIDREGQSDLVIATTLDDGSIAAHLVAPLPVAIEIPADPVASVDEDGTLSLTWDDGAGEERVIKLRLNSEAPAADAEGKVQVKVNSAAR